MRELFATEIQEFENKLKAKDKQIDKLNKVVEAANGCISEYMCDYGTAEAQEKANAEYREALAELNNKG